MRVGWPEGGLGVSSGEGKWCECWGFLHLKVLWHLCSRWAEVLWHVLFGVLLLEGVSPGSRNKGGAA